MGCFSYICPVCKINIRTGEKCVLIHKRDGKEIGRTRGHYNGYGGVEEDVDILPMSKGRGFTPLFDK